MSGFNMMRVAVSVATVWTSPDSPRPMDEPALRKPADITGWLHSMKITDRLELCDANRVQTQVLYGTEVVVSEQSGNWMKIHIPEQYTSKNLLGYPGWVPVQQLREPLGESASADIWAVVASTRAILSLDSSQTEIELSFLTRLPVIEQSAEGIVVDTPDGTGLLNKDDVLIIRSNKDLQPSGSAHTGHRIVDQGSRFIGLPYLWGGMSSYGYDCSGFTYSMYKSQGILIPRDASEQARQGQEIARDRLEPGDLLFFARERGRGRVHHVGIYAGGGRMLHSPDSGGSVELIDLVGYKLADEHCISRRY